MAKFNQETLDAIKKDPALFIAVSQAMGIDPGSLPKAIQRNGPSLNQYSIVAMVAKHLGKEPQEVLDEDIVNVGGEGK